MAAEKPIRVALIGYGFVGKTFHAPLIKSVPGLEIAVVGSRNAEKVRANVPDAQVIADPQGAATSENADLVVIATPNETHVPLATAALNAGKDVVIDKPFTITLAEARKLTELARKEKRLLSVFQNRRWDSEFLGARAIIEGGRLGEVLHFESHFDRFRPEVRIRWRETPGPGSGVWYDLGPHLVDQALQLFGLPKTIAANLAVQRRAAQTIDWFHVLLNYDRLRVILHGSVLVAGGTPRMAIHGTGGSWLKYGLDVQEEQLISGMIPGEPGWGQDPRPALFYDGQNSQPEEIALPAGDQRQYYFGVRDAIRNQRTNPISPAQAVAVMAAIETAIESSKSGKALPLPLTEAEQAAWSESLKQFA